MCTLTHFILFIAITPNRDDSCKYRIHHLMQYPKVVFKGTERERETERTVDGNCGDKTRIIYYILLQNRKRNVETHIFTTQLLTLHRTYRNQ
jgi:hypothetical protein